MTKTAIITDSSAPLSDEIKAKANVFVLDISVYINGETYVEGVNLTAEQFYLKMAETTELPKTSQPSVLALEELLTQLQKENYTHVMGIFLSSGISGFWQNIQYLTSEYEGMTIVFPDTKMTSSPLGHMVETAYNMTKTNASFDLIVSEINETIAKTSIFIIVNDLNHLVKGGRLSNGAAVIGNLLNIKPILWFDEVGKIVVYEKIRTSKKAFKRLYKILAETTKDGEYKLYVIHANVPEKARDVAKELSDIGFDVSIATFGSVIGTHLGEGALGFGISPKLNS
ncbi:DegV family protein [Pseudolactococcus hodotermopsidis]|nr:DegV family protein [Lactococcus hodotermopsidis]